MNSGARHTKVGEAAEMLRRGRQVHLRSFMGSCQCGDHAGTLWVDAGVVMADCSGRMAWQKYLGPAADCEVQYGWGATARAIAAAYIGLAPVMTHAFEGTDFCPREFADW